MSKTVEGSTFHSDATQRNALIEETPQSKGDHFEQPSFTCAPVSETDLRKKTTKEE